ncbi:MAG: hypothetical protein ABS79_05480 [Planctomycetes bacterium SCN 63-9]|nr:MAG: hypothetical protein ABS79_05480 [Planctomycetes bacterium SCN 63-9]
MDGFFNRFAWAWLDGRASDFLGSPVPPVGNSMRTAPKKTWSKHAGHRRTLAPHRVSSRDRDDQAGPSAGA